MKFIDPLGLPPQFRCETTGMNRNRSKAHAKAAKKRDKSINQQTAKVFHCEHCGGWHYEGSR